MSTPTSNFGWQMPTATDLVTDLPADFAVFGQAVDTSMADLKGGTTGQILSKATSTDMDFTWITNDVGDITAVTAGTGISGGGTSGAVTVTNSMATAITTAGDVIYGTGSGTFARLGIGTAGQTLKVNSGATAPEWQTASAGALTLISTTNSSAVSSSVTYTNCFTSSYRNYLVNIDGALSASSGFIQIQMRASGTTQTTNYYGGRYQVGTSGSGYSVGQTNAGSWEICDGSSNKFTISANIMTPQVGKVQCNTRYWTRNGDTGGIQQGFIDTATSYDSMVLAFSGTFTGTVSIYGYGI
jgi:hypothetical protein